MKTKPNDTLLRVKAALTRSGYTFEADDDILSAQFLGWNDSDSEVHEITFYSQEGEGEIESGFIYIDKYGKGEF
jgi:hypothetical protein